MCHLIAQSPETLCVAVCVYVCVKVIRPAVQTALSANNNGYFLLISPCSAVVPSWQIDVQRLHLLIVASVCGPVKLSVI